MKRDVNRALDLLAQVDAGLAVSFAGTPGEAHAATLREGPVKELGQVLKTMDARTGRRDPSKRKPAAKKAAKKGARR